MNLLKEVLKYQVFPAMGCTEPVAVALCAANAAKALGEPVQEAVFMLDSATYKNGMGVNIPNTRGEKGNLLAGALGLQIAKPELKMEILKGVKSAMLPKAKRMIDGGMVRMSVDPDKKTLYIEARVAGKKNRAVCVIAGGHTNVVLLEKNSRRLRCSGQACKTAAQSDYKTVLGKKTIQDLVALANKADKEDLAYIKKGVEMNLAAAAEGLKLRKVGFYLIDLLKKGYLQDDVFASSKILSACAADARMDGAPIPVMSSGASGNQGIVASLVPYNVGKAFGVKEEKIYRSIALSHLLNGYVKVYTGGLAPICGCAIAAGVGAAAAIVYQIKGNDPGSISLAVNTLISDLGGMLCDGAKSGCSLKIISSTDSAIRAAYMAVNDYGITEVEGFVGKTAEETIRNLASISNVGMEKVDPMIVGIMIDKQKSRR